MKRFLFVLAFLCLHSTYAQQVISVTPIFPTENDTVTIVFDATEGNGELEGVTPVYAHTGVVTDASATPTTWRHVQGTWGTADPDLLMTDLGNDRHQIKYHIKSFYNVPANESVQSLAFVFRNTTGTQVGRAADGSDIFYPVYDGSTLASTFIQPANESFYQINDNFTIEAAVSSTADIELYIDNVLVSQTNGTSINYTETVTNTGKHWIKLVADNGTASVSDSIYYVVNEPINQQDPPAAIEDGINYLNDTTVMLSLYAPNKNFVYVIGDFNQWEVDPNYAMNLSMDGNRWWLEISGLTPQQEYAFQYFVDGEIRIADPYSEKVLDPSNDQFINATTYPNLKPYPDGKTTGIVTLLQTAQTPYNWQTTNYQRPKKTDLVIYETLLRDFTNRHDYSALIDSLNYLENLGINAIQLMPIMEFEGNDSWGYNPSFFTAVDKYYGPADDLKRLVDEAHARGMAVILDIALNHAFSQCPLNQLYWDAVQFKPTPDNPWLNPDARHPFNVGYDFNHESPATQYFSHKVFRYWIEEFKVDGYRLDLSKGFTQVNSGSNVGLWGQYDASRIGLLKMYADSMWSVDPETYVILEHFADNNEERELSNHGMMLWGNMNYSYNEATMGWLANSNFEGVSHKNRGWQDAHLIGYMESHDEERLMFRNLEYGRTYNNYDITDLPTALERVELASVLFFTVPGPKMMWQFGEMGYDVSIDNPCRLCPKPPRWFYLDDPYRYHLYQVTSALIKLRVEEPAFESNDFNLYASGGIKRLEINHSDMDVLAIGNFNVLQLTTPANFQQGGWWYEFFTGDSINVMNTAMDLTLEAGEYRLYTTKRLTAPELISTSIEDELGEHPFELRNYPNPFSTNLTVAYSLPKASEVRIRIFDMFGKEIARIAEEKQAAGMHELQWDASGLAKGSYIVRVEADGVVDYAIVNRM